MTLKEYFDKHFRNGNPEGDDVVAAAEKVSITEVVRMREYLESQWGGGIRKWDLLEKGWKSANLPSQPSGSSPAFVGPAASPRTMDTLEPGYWDRMEKLLRRVLDTK